MTYEAHDPWDPEAHLKSLGTHPVDPDVAVTFDWLIMPVESKALTLLRRKEAPTKREVLRLFRGMPQSFRKRDKDGLSYVVGGANPRNKGLLLSHSIDVPLFNCVVARFLRSIAPNLAFTTYVIREGCRSEPHRDTNNGPYPSLVVGLTPPSPGSGLWIQDWAGPVAMLSKGFRLQGTVLNIDEPVIFDARRRLHAGYVSEPLARASDRVVLVAFCTMTAPALDMEIIPKLRSLGFSLPTPEHADSLGMFPGAFRKPICNASFQACCAKLEHVEVVEVLDSE